jgi:hypothetical protein
MAKVSPVSIKYMVYASFKSEGPLEKPTSPKAKRVKFEEKDENYEEGEEEKEEEKEEESGSTKEGQPDVKVPVKKVVKPVILSKCTITGRSPLDKILNNLYNKFVTFKNEFHFEGMIPSIGREGIITLKTTVDTIEKNNKITDKGEKVKLATLLGKIRLEIFGKWDSIDKKTRTTVLKQIYSAIDVLIKDISSLASVKKGGSRKTRKLSKASNRI